MMKTMCFVILLVLALAIVGVAAEAPSVGNITIYPETVLQGDCFYINVSRLPEGVTPLAHWQGKEIPLYPGKWGWRGILPVWVETAVGAQKLAVSWKVGNTMERRERSVTVKKQAFGIQHLKLAPQQESLYTYEGVEREYELIGGALKKCSPEMLWNGNFIVPVQGRKSTAFGLRRFRNGVKQGIHKGVDYGAPQGTPVKAANTGVVILTAEDFKMHGKTVVVDHGRGVLTLYLHLSEILVQPGQCVQKGDVIAEVGDTGVATGPHLHYALYTAGVAVNPGWWESAAR